MNCFLPSSSASPSVASRRFAFLLAVAAAADGCWLLIFHFRFWAVHFLRCLSALVVRSGGLALYECVCARGVFCAAFRLLAKIFVHDNIISDMSWWEVGKGAHFGDNCKWNVENRKLNC